MQDLRGAAPSPMPQPLDVAAPAPGAPAVHARKFTPYPREVPLPVSVDFRVDAAEGLVRTLSGPCGARGSTSAPPAPASSTPRGLRRVSRAGPTRLVRRGKQGIAFAVCQQLSSSAAQQSGGAVDLHRSLGRRRARGLLAGEELRTAVDVAGGAAALESGLQK